jgi:outer membrane receptor protein involved in Fe transport
MYKPSANQTVRASFNRAFRAPSLINNHLDVTILTPVTLPTGALFAFPTRAVGNPGLEEETLTAFELGYTGVVGGRTTVTASVYWNSTDGTIGFTPVTFYGSTAPPPGWPFPAAAVPVNTFPSSYTYLNLGTVKDKGIELGADTAINRFVSVFANYSYQWMPEIEDFPPGVTINDVNWPAKNRFNAGFNFNYQRYLGNLSVNYTDVLAGRARRSLRGDDRCVYAGQRRRRSPLARGADRHECEGDQHRRSGSAAAHLRRHPAPPGRR